MRESVVFLNRYNFRLEEDIKMQIFGVISGSLIVVVAFNLFLIPQGVLSGGMSGISMIFGMITPINTGLANFLLNLPLLIIGYKILGKKFIVTSIFSVLIISLGLYVIPVYAIANDTILSAIFGGALTGLGTGIVFRCSGSTGGFDIIGMIVARKRDFPIGVLLSGMNAVVILISGFLFDWNAALYTLVSIYVTGKVVDTIYTDHAKLTLMIITENGMGKRTLLEHYPLQKRSGLGVKVSEITKRTGKVAAAKLISDRHDEIVISTKSGKAIKTPISKKSIPTLTRPTQGVILMKLEDNDQIAAVALTVEEDDKT